jgi:hypothetical protein
VEKYTWGKEKKGGTPFPARIRNFQGRTFFFCGLLHFHWTKQVRGKSLIVIGLEGTGLQRRQLVK